MFISFSIDRLFLILFMRAFIVMSRFDGLSFRVRHDQVIWKNWATFERIIRSYSSKVPRISPANRSILFILVQIYTLERVRPFWRTLLAELPLFLFQKLWVRSSLGLFSNKTKNHYWATEFLIGGFTSACYCHFIREWRSPPLQTEYCRIVGTRCKVHPYLLPHVLG